MNAFGSDGEAWRTWSAVGLDAGHCRGAQCCWLENTVERDSRAPQDVHVHVPRNLLVIHESSMLSERCSLPPSAADDEGQFTLLHSSIVL